MAKKILLSLSIAVILATAQMAYAADSVLYISPSSHSNTVGSNFTISAKIDPAGNKVCVVKGTLSFGNLTCRSITVANGLMAQTSPTCSSPSFTLGIPGCTTAAKTILSVSVRGTQAGQGILSFTGVKVIGEGTILPSSLQNGVYDIVASQPTPEAPATTTTNLETTTIENPAASTTTITLETGATPTFSENENLEPENGTGSDGQDTPRQTAGLLSSMANILSFGTGNNLLAIIILIILIAVITYFVWRSGKGKNK